MKKQTLTILGSTGTIGINTLSVVSQHPERFDVVALTGGSNVKLLAEQARLHAPRYVAIADQSCYEELKALLFDTDITVAAGQQAVTEAADIAASCIISAIVGAAALAPTLAAIAQGARVGLANKECLVCAGPQVMQAAAQSGCELLPIDSEHNSIYQLIGNEVRGVKQMLLTASGGPFRHYTATQLQHVTIDEAVNHPNWKMGAKISVDSASMMNKGLELIEAHYLFGIASEKLDAVIHPKSLVHALVVMEDNAILAGISDHDMRIPIAYALGYPDRLAISSKELDITQIGTLHFEPVDVAHYPCFSLAKQALQSGSQAAHITLNAANEVAVAAFLEKRIGFTQIAGIVDGCLSKNNSNAIASVEDVIALDNDARHWANALI